MMADPSQTPAEFLEGWMYREEDVSAPPPATLLVEWLGRRIVERLGGSAVFAASGGAAGAPLSYGARDSPSMEPPPAMVEPHGVPYEQIAAGDVYYFMCHNLYQKPDRAHLSAEEDAELMELVAEIEEAAGKQLRRQHDAAALARTADEPTTPGVRHMSASAEAVRWRHRPLLYYAVSHGVVAGLITPVTMHRAGFVQRREGALKYWFRPAARSGAADEEAFVFIHGVGFGPFPYVSSVERWAGGAPVLMVELEGATQRVAPPMPPDPDRFAALLDAALDASGVRRAVLAGHSLGSAFVSYAARRDGLRAAGGGKRRFGGAVFIDPIACGLHHSRTTREFVYTRIERMQHSIEDYIFKKELWTATVIARHLPWHDASLWLDDCVPAAPTLLAVGACDTIIHPRRIAQAFGSWNARLRGVRVLTMADMGHGGWLQDETSSAVLAASILALRQESASIGAAEAAAEAAAESLKEAAGAATEPLTDQLKIMS
eukprot:2096968-Prymnesium_polylepis.1